ncbi:hypothetical protein N9W89_12095 [Hellea sp.]|nr:hypothetical protein [Hellea sp.]
MKKLQVNISGKNKQDNSMPEIRIFDHKLKELSRQKAWSIEETLKPGLYKISAKIPGKRDIEKVIAFKDQDQTIDLDVQKKLAAMKKRSVARKKSFKKAIKSEQFEMKDAERAEGKSIGPASFTFSAKPALGEPWKTPWARISYKADSYLLSLPLDPQADSQCHVKFYSAANRRYPKCQVKVDDPNVARIINLLRLKKLDAASKLANENLNIYEQDDKNNIAYLICLLALYKAGELGNKAGEDRLKRAAEKYASIPDVRIFHFYLKAEEGSLTKKDLDEFLKLTENRMLFTDAYSAMIGLLRQIHDGPVKKQGYLAKLTSPISTIVNWKNHLSKEDRHLLADRLKDLAKYTVNVDWTEPFLVIFQKAR